MMKYKKKSAATALLLIFLLIYSLIFYFNGALANSDSLKKFEEWIPYDSIFYVERSENLIITELSVIDIATGAMNWLSLSLIYKFLNDIGGIGSLSFIFINSLCFYLSIKLSPSSIEKYHPNLNAAYYPAIVFVCSPYLLAWFLVPNKELLFAAGILCSLYAITTNKARLLIITAVIIGTIKIQIIISTAIYLILKQFKWRKTILIGGISIIYPILHSAVPSLQMSNFLEVNPNEIRSASIFLAIDSLSEYPFGFIIIFFARLVLNLTGGINPIRIIENGFSMSSLAPLTSFILGVLVLLSAFNAIKRKNIKDIFTSKSDKIFYIYCIFTINLSLPFMQPRYFWWLIPILLTYLMFNEKKISRQATRPLPLKQHDQDH